MTKITITVVVLLAVAVGALIGIAWSIARALSLLRRATGTLFRSH